MFPLRSSAWFPLRLELGAKLALLPLLVKGIWFCILAFEASWLLQLLCASLRVDGALLGRSNREFSLSFVCCQCLYAESGSVCIWAFLFCLFMFLAGYVFSMTGVCFCDIFQERA